MDKLSRSGQDCPDEIMREELNEEPFPDNDGQRPLAVPSSTASGWIFHLQS